MQILRAAAVIFSLLLLPVTGASADTPPKPIKIGALLHLTGEFALQGVAFQRGIELAVFEVNAAGGVKGRPLEAIFEDTQYKPLPSSIGAKKLAEIDHAAAVLISTATEAKAAGTVLQGFGVPTIVLWDSSPEIEALGDYVFGIGPWAPSSGERAAQFAADTLHAKSAAIVSSNTEWSQYVSKYFADTAKAHGMQITGNYALNPEEADFRTVLTKVRALKPGAVFAPIDGNIIPFFQQARQMRLGVPLVTSDIVTEEYLTTEAQSFEGVYQTMTGDPTFPASVAMYKAFQAHFGKPITQAQFVAWGYDGIKLLAHVMESTGDDRAAIKSALHAAKGFEGASGVITMTEKGSAPRPVHIFQVKNGAFAQIEP